MNGCVIILNLNYFFIFELFCYGKLTNEFDIRNVFSYRIRHQCPECPKTFTQKRSLSLHQRVEHIGVRFPCEFCGKELKRKEYLTRHQEKCRGKGNFVAESGSAAKWIVLSNDCDTDEENVHQSEPDAVEAVDLNEWRIVDEKDEKLIRNAENDDSDFVCHDGNHNVKTTVEKIKKIDKSEKQIERGVVSPEVTVQLVKFCTECGSKFTTDFAKCCGNFGTRRGTMPN